MGCSAHHHQHLNFISNFLKQACYHCLHSPSSFDESEESDTVVDSDFDIREVILMEIKNRALEANAARKENPDSFCWVLTPTTGEDGDGSESFFSVRGDDGSENFFSVRSYLSRCSSGATFEFKDFRGKSIWDEFRHCDGWPFGLHRRAVVLPPLPRSPLDSWTWSKRSLNNKASAAV